MKFALAIDGSNCSLRATHFLIGLIEGRAGAEVHVLNVRHPLRYFDALPMEKQQLVEHTNLENGKRETTEARDMLATAKVPYQLHVVAGDPATGIVKLARDLRCDLIVMGTRGMGTIAGLVLGSVATKVVHLADMPVTLVR
jgi:nucleotide-binding universal stress UspA family protein